MNDDAPLLALFFVGTVIGFGLGMFVWTATANNSWEAAAIKHGAAHYHPTTGKFTWNAEVKP